MDTLSGDLLPDLHEPELEGEEGKERRMRKLTGKAMEIYMEKKRQYKDSLSHLASKVNNLIDSHAQLPETLHDLKGIDRQLASCYNEYESVSAEYIAYLHRARTEDSVRCVTSVTSEVEYLHELVNIFKTSVRESILNITRETASVKSKALSRQSNVSALKQAEVEAARVKTKFAEKEIAMKKKKALLIEKETIANATANREKAELEAEMELLVQKKEFAVAEAEAAVLDDTNMSGKCSFKPELKSVEDPMERVEKFLKKQSEFEPEKEEFPTGEDLLPDPPQVTEKFPATYAANDLTKFLLRKDLSLSRLSSFNDKPENYHTWKASFCDVTKELEVSASEEIDLLIKWLGVESKKYAISIRAANAGSPVKGLQKIWERLDERFGAPELIHAVVMKRLDAFPKLGPRDSTKLYDLADILAEIEGLKADPRYATMLSYFDSSAGISPVVNKLPYAIQEKWTTRAYSYKTTHGVVYPPFWVFTEFIRDQAKRKNDPGFIYSPAQAAVDRKVDRKTVVSSRKTDIKREQDQAPATQDTLRCPLHKTKHTLNRCRAFKTKSFEERRDFLRENNLCFRCCESAEHAARDCKKSIQCADCSSTRHTTAMHINRDIERPVHGGEDPAPQNVAPKCTQICGNNSYRGKSCAKLVLVKVFPESRPELETSVYAILDEQSNRSLAKPELFAKLGIQTESEQFEYTLNSCSGTIVKSGRRVNNCILEAADSSVRYRLPTLIECAEIPNIRDEIPTPAVARNHHHLRDIAHCIPEIDEEADILLLIGRDMIDVHHVHEQKIGPPGSPYAQRLSLGWVVVGEVCLGKVHQPDFVNANKTYLVSDGRESICQPCPNNFKVKENVMTKSVDDDLFVRTENDNKVGLSVEDRIFLDDMADSLHKLPSGNWVAPLPFRHSRSRLPNNKQQAMHRAKILDTSLKKNPLKRQHFTTFMDGLFRNSHAEVAPPVEEGEECWYLPLFGVYHPKKPDQIRGVFDASAKYQGVSLNDVLLPGPDLANSLLGVLLRFRREAVAVTADIQQMFYCFLVEERHRNFLRFLWYKDNDPDKDIIEFRMRVHVFGNSPSPAIATYCLRKTALISVEEFGADVADFVTKDFYVDDGLTSLPTPAQAIDLLKRTQQSLKCNGNLRLHKIASNSQEVMQAFPADDLAKDLAHLDLSKDAMPLQRSLGLGWNLDDDTFTFQVSREKKDYTRRGILSTVNSIFDPIGLVAPVVVTGKLLLRELVNSGEGWDSPLPEDGKSKWETWRDALVLLEQINIARVYLRDATEKRLCIFSDASESAIAAVAYLVCPSGDGTCQSSLVLGKAKVAPKTGHTIPRLELCAAVLAVQIYETIREELDYVYEEVQFYTDSKVVLGYIQNRTRRFYTYVSNRVERIQRATKPEQWFYVRSENNPADCGTRPLNVEDMMGSAWLRGPDQIDNPNCVDSFPLVEPETDKEIRSTVNTLSTYVSPSRQLDSHRFERFSSWNRLVCAIGLLVHVMRSFKAETKCKGWHACAESREPANKKRAEQCIIRTAQEDAFQKEVSCLENGKEIPRNSTLLNLNPMLDSDNVLRVGGRLNQATISSSERNPIIIPKKSHIATLIVRHYHEQNKHQGRHITEGAIRAAGFWIIGCKRLVSSIIHDCVQCRKLRRKVSAQKMSDLPSDRVQPSPPFTCVGVDTFGPWEVVARRTRGGHANSKRWAILFTCLSIRAVHIEVVDALTSSAFINALRRFMAIRGEVKEFRSDRGSNFVCAVNELGIEAVSVQDAPVKKFLDDKRAVWLFNPPYASHMGGVWERMIGVTRRILDSMLMDPTTKPLTHEVLTTLLAEVCAIINARPLVPVGSDPECPEILSPSKLLLQKETGAVNLCPEPFDPRIQWKQVQALADRFWRRWRVKYLQTLQPRRKWTTDQPNLQPGDVVLLRDKEVYRNDWPLGVIVNVFPSVDKRVRKAEVRVVKQGRPCLYVRPISEFVLLVSSK